jgi:two-component system OmpR family sensor kinase/two-component system sensor histidine kinase BaeS
MNKLWVRLSIAFGSVVLIAVLLVVLAGILVSWVNRPENFRPEFLRAPSGLVEQLSLYYKANQNWSGVELVLGGAQSTFRAEWGQGLVFFLADTGERVIYHDRRDHIGKRLAKVPHIQTLPIEVNGETVGYLGVAQRFGPGGSERAGPPPLIDRIVGTLLTIALVGGGIGLVFGVFVSRSLTAPLDKLAEGAKAIGDRNLSQRVEVSGSDEIIAVARAFNDMASNLELGEQLRRNLLADVAHELRTPLTVVQGNLRAMLDDVYDLEKDEVARLYEQTRVLSRLVNDLHELAQAEANQLQLNLHETDLSRLIASTCDTFSPVAEEQGVTLTANVPSDLPLIRVDAARLTQVVHNLLNNGLRHTPAGGTISVSAVAEPDRIRLAVSDSGEGISLEHLPYVFDRFYRTDPARSRDRGGAGLGLAIARAIIQAHDGQISVASAGIPGQGTTFTIDLPLRTT